MYVLVYFVSYLLFLNIPIVKVKLPVREFKVYSYVGNARRFNFS